MSPVHRSVVKFTQRIRNSALRNLTLSLIEEASKKPDLAPLTDVRLKELGADGDRNPSHTSHTDSKPHVTVLFATEEQARNNKAHPVHIYHDSEGNYAGHMMYPERDTKPSDE